MANYFSDAEKRFVFSFVKKIANFFIANCKKKLQIFLPPLTLCIRSFNFSTEPIVQT